MSGVRINLDQDRPTHRKWIKYQGVDTGWHEVSGTMHRLDDVTNFLMSAQKAKRKGASFRLELERDPTNPYDKNAIKVFGIAPRLKIFGLGPETRYHIGFVDAENAEKIAETYSPQMPLSAVVVKGFISDKGGAFVDMEILIPGKAERTKMGW